MAGNPAPGRRPVGERCDPRRLREIPAHRSDQRSATRQSLRAPTIITRIDTETTALIGIDWGTSQLRGYRMGRDGRVLDRRETAHGIATIGDGGFDRPLFALIADWKPAAGTVPILMCGMIGSRQGWREVPYRPCPARAADLAKRLDTVDTSCGPAFIISGLSTLDGDGRRDVMRGEETQILGGLSSVDHCLVVTPGTHSKWAVVEDGAIRNFRTYMTGEIFDLLRNRSSLAWVMQDADDQCDEDAFVFGVRRAAADSNLLSLLFSVRTSGLFADRSSTALASYLSGLLIGSEIAGELRRQSGSPIVVIASPALGRLYELAISAAGLSRITTVDAGEATTRGLWRLWQLHNGVTQQ